MTGRQFSLSIDTPTTKELADNIFAQIQSSTSKTIRILPRSFISVLSKAIAAVIVILYKYGGFIFLQMFPSTASSKDTVVNGVTINPLKFLGRLVGVGDPKPATSAELTIDVTVTNEGDVLPAGSQLVSSFNGVTYITSSAVTLGASVVSVNVIAVSDQGGGGGAGVIGNLDAGDPLSFANPIANVSRETIVTAQIVTGADEESVDNYRQRVIDRFQKRPQGGALADIEQWAKEAAGIIKAYPYTGLPGQVDVYSEATVDSSGNPDGIPTTAQLEAVLGSINFDSSGIARRKNANAFINSLPITRQGFDVLVTGISGVDELATVQSDIQSALSEYFLSAEPFIAGLSILPRLDQITRTKISAIVEDIVTAAGGIFESAIFNYEGVAGSIPSHILLEGQKSKLSNLGFL